MSPLDFSFSPLIKCDGRLYVTMAYYEGQMLDQKIASASLSLEESLDIAVQVARGLGRAHEAGIIHRDVKPSNIALTRHGEVKILDFGVAKFGRRADLTQPGAVIGTASYMSPEQARGEEVDHRRDPRKPGMDSDLQDLVSRSQIKDLTLNNLAALDDDFILPQSSYIF